MFVLCVWLKGIQSTIRPRFIANFTLPIIADIGKAFPISLCVTPKQQAVSFKIYMPYVPCVEYFGNDLFRGSVNDWWINLLINSVKICIHPLSLTASLNLPVHRWQVLVFKNHLWVYKFQIEQPNREVKEGILPIRPFCHHALDGLSYCSSGFLFFLGSANNFFLCVLSFSLELYQACIMW